MNIDHLDALEMIETAYMLLCEFQQVIDGQLEGDCPHAGAVDNWLTLYEKFERVLEVPEIEGAPV